MTETKTPDAVLIEGKPFGPDGPDGLIVKLSTGRVCYLSYTEGNDIFSVLYRWYEDRGMLDAAAGASPLT